MKRVALVGRIPVGECGGRYRDKAAAVVASIILVCKVLQLFLLRAIAERGHHGTPLCEFASNENKRENIKLAIAFVFLMAGLASAQTKQITIGSLQYAGTAVSIFDGVTVESAYNVNLDASKVAVDPIEFKNIEMIVLGGRAGSGPINTGPACGTDPESTVPCQLSFTSILGNPQTLPVCATLTNRPWPNNFTQNCVSIAAQLKSKTGGNFTIQLLDGETFCTYGVTNVYLTTPPNQLALSPNCSQDPGFCGAVSTPIVLRALPAKSCGL